MGERDGSLEGMVMNPEFWKGKKVLVTGHTGFIGTWLSLLLQGLDSKLVGFSLAPPTHPNFFSLAKLSDSMTSIEGDVRDLSSLQSAVFETQANVIFHLAGQSLVGRSYLHPLETFATNVTGTLNILQASIQESSARVVVCVTSDKCYRENEDSRPHREGDFLGGNDPYSSSKACAELAIDAFRRSYFAKNGDLRALASVRGGNVIGGGDWAQERLIPDVVRALERRTHLGLRHPEARRSWQHVLDFLRGCLLLAEKLWDEPGSAGPFNLGSSEEQSPTVAWMVEAFLKEWGGSVELLRPSQKKSDERLSLLLDSSKAERILGWRPKLGPQAAIRWAVDWYKHFLGNGNIPSFSREQIRRFMEERVS